jgi:O-antigen ligase
MGAYPQEWKANAMSEPDAMCLDSLPDGERIDRYLRASIEAFLFVLVVAMFPFTMDPTGDIKFALCGWASLLLLLGWVFSVWRTGRAFRRPQVFLEILVLFLILGVVSSFCGAHVRNSLAEMGRFWSVFILYLVASQVYRTNGQVRRLMLVVCAAVALSSIYALFIQRLGFDPFPWRDRTSDEYVNLPATFGNPNFAAHTLILAIIMALYLAADLRMVWALGFALLFLVHLYFTHQRAGVLALAAAALLVAVGLLMRKLLRSRAKPMLRPIGAAITTLAVVGVLGVMGLGLAMGVSQLRHGSPYPLDLSLLIRYKSYCSAANMILTRPILGYGPANYKIEYPRFWTPY